jgi:vancomycin resistance protein VanJ
MSITSWLAGLAYVYLLVLLGWAGVYLLFGDRWWWLFLLNSFAQYLFLPLPAVLAVALFARQPPLWAGFAVVLALWVYLCGGLFVPKSPSEQARNTALTVMSFNVLYHNQHPEGVVAAIRASGADVVALQELNPPIGATIQRELASDYPYQVLDPHADDSGMGVISRYPLRSIEEDLCAAWLGSPQLLALDLQGTTVLLLNIHAVAPLFPKLQWTVRERERQARIIANFAARIPEPLIVLGDFNAGDLSAAYAIVTRTLVDSWREAGWGLGHTFPGAASPGSSRPSIAGFHVPMWLVRLDYVFHSNHWQAASARIGHWDGVSDHRPVEVRLVLRKP